MNSAKIKENSYTSTIAEDTVNYVLTTYELRKLNKLATGHGKRIPLAAAIGIHVNTLRRVLGGNDYEPETAELIRTYLKSR